ncbi:hypothetical protein ACSBR1_027296 [Camellia fascicularis]
MHNGCFWEMPRPENFPDMVTTINNAPKGYKSPNYEKVRTSLLDKEPSKAIFINGHDVFSKEKNATNIADLLFKAIEFVGLSNVVQVVTNNAINCKAVGAIIQHKYSHIFWLGCLAYTLNLLMKDIAKYEDPTLLFVDESYKRGKEVHDIVHQTIMDDDFWRKAKRVLTITKHIYKMLRFSDSDKAVIREVYELMDTMLGNIKDTHSNDPIVYDLILQFVVERWDKMNIPLHCLAYILVPKYYTNSWLSKSALGGVRKKKPHFDVEVQKGYLEVMEKMISDQTEAAVIRKQISDFVSCKGVFSQPQAVNNRATMDALSWWHLYGGAAPELYSLALKVLSQKDAHPEDANIEEDIMAIEERDNVSLSDSEDDTTLVASDVQPCPTPTPLPTFSSFPLPTSQEHSMEQVAAKRRLEKARGKR